jgi:hypothetical protein
VQQRHWDPVCPPPVGLVVPVRVDPSGMLGPTLDQARGPRWRRSSPGYYVPASVDADRVEQRILEQVPRLPAGGAVTGWAALRMSRAAFFDGLDRDGRTRLPVPLVVGPRGNVRRQPEVTVSREPLGADDVVTRFGVPCVRDQRALFDQMRAESDEREAVVDLDKAAAAERVSVRQMRDFHAKHSGWRRSTVVARSLPLADERTRSPNETRTRLIWVLDAGLPRPLVNQPVFTRVGVLIGVPDLLDPVAGMVCEFDGADHRGARRHSRDVAREEEFRRAGLEYCKVTGPDLADRARVAARMLSTRSRARFLPDVDRAWTVRPPAGWPEEDTLDERLEVRAVMTEFHRESELWHTSGVLQAADP